MTYHVVYGFVDTNKCTVAVLHVSINVAGGGEQPGTTTPSGPELSVVVTNVSVEQLCGDKYSHAVTVYYDTSGGTAPVSIEGIYWTYPNGSTSRTTGISMASGWLRSQISYPNGGQITVRVQAQDGAGHTASDTGTAYLPPCGEVGTPPTVTPQPGEQPCVHVSAVVASGQMQTTTHYLPQYTEIPVKMAVNGHLQRTTPYDLCGSAGTQFTIQTQADFWTQQKAHLIFLGWQRYDEQNKQWIPLSSDQKVTQNPNLRITLQNGGSLRAVYQQREQG